MKKANYLICLVSACFAVLGPGDLIASQVKDGPEGNDEIYEGVEALAGQPNNGGSPLGEMITDAPLPLDLCSKFHRLLWQKMTRCLGSDRQEKVINEVVDQLLPINREPVGEGSLIREVFEGYRLFLGRGWLSGLLCLQPGSSQEEDCRALGMLRRDFLTLSYRQAAGQGKSLGLDYQALSSLKKQSVELTTATALCNLRKWVEHEEKTCWQRTLSKMWQATKGVLCCCSRKKND